MARKSKSASGETPATVRGGFRCPRCGQPLSTTLPDWGQVHPHKCPRCHTYLMAPPVSLHTPRDPEDRSFLTICPKCYRIESMMVGEEANSCPDCRTQLLVAPFDEQLEAQRAQSRAAAAGDDAGPEARLGADETQPMSAERTLNTTIPGRIANEAFRLDAICCNPFWLLGLPSTARARDVKRACQRWEGRLRLRPKVPKPKISLGGAFADRQAPRDKEGFLERLRLAENPKQRFLHSLFWPCWNDEGPARAGMPAFLADRGSHPASPLERRHALAAAALITAVAQELDYVEGTDPDCPAPAKIWETAVTNWGHLVTMSAFWEHLRKSAKALKTLEVREEDVAALQGELPLFILGILRVFVEAYLRAGRIDDCRRLLAVVAGAPFEDEAVNACLGDAIDGLSTVRSERLVARAKMPIANRANKERVGYAEFRDHFDPIIDEAETVGELVSTELMLGGDLADRVNFDSFIRTVMSMVSTRLDYGNKDESRERNLLQGLLTLKRLQALPMTDGARSALDTTLEETYRQLHHSDITSSRVDYCTCCFLPGEPADAEHSLVLPVSKVTDVRIEGHTWATKRILIPRSGLAASMHAGKTSKKALLQAHPRSVRLRALTNAKGQEDEGGAAFRIFREAVSRTMDAFATFEEACGSASLGYGENHPSDDDVAELEQMKASLAETEADADTRLRALRTKHGCGTNAVWRCYLPGLVVGGGLLLGWMLVPAGTLPIDPALQISRSGLTLARGLLGQAGVFIGIGVMLGGVFHRCNHGNWRRAGAGLREAVETERDALSERESTVWGAAAAMRDRYVSSVKTFRQTLDQAGGDARRQLEAVTSSKITFEDLRPLRKRKTFPVFAAAIKDGYESGTTVSAAGVMQKRLALVDDMSDAQVDQKFLELAMQAVKSGGLDGTAILAIAQMSTYQKRAKLREIVRAS